jgi:lysophospholipase L1-like esterase
MNRRYLLTTSLALGTVPLIAQEKPKAKAATPDVSKLDPAMGAQKAAAKKLTWHNPEQWGVEGRCWPDEPRSRYYDRFPASAEGKVTPAVWSLSRNSAGMAVLFNSDATDIHVRYTLSADVKMAHMPPTGHSGVDLYARDDKGQWRWVNVSRPAPGAKEVVYPLSEKMEKKSREWMLYLPLYNGVEKLEIGVNEGAEFKGVAPAQKGLVVFYGTSITHGACASRPGMCHPAILGRRLGKPVLNLGFSGNGRMDAAVGDFLGRLDAAVFVIDCLPNMDAKLVTERCVPLVKQLRAARPDTPIVLVEDRRNTNSWIHPDRAAHHTANHAALKAAFTALQSEGVKRLYYVEGDDLLGQDGDGTTDGSHPNDLGFVRQADVIEPVLREALKA